jgi:hypothetical protein
VLVAIDRALELSIDEVRYTIGVLCSTAGFPVHFVWSGTESSRPDIHYGPRRDVDAGVHIPAVPWPFHTAPLREPTGTRESLTLPFLVWDGEPWVEAGDSSANHLDFPTDIVFASFWLLTGSREPTYARSRFDDLDLDRSVLVRNALLVRPAVSLYAARIRDTLDPGGERALPWAWEQGPHVAAFAFTHDVDYPVMIRPIEVLRVLRDRGLAGLSLARRVATGESHFWTFVEWVDLARRFGTHPCFYFMARQGSLLQYAMGTPDDFYDVDTPRFRQLFAELRDSGCEIGLHASFHAYRSVETLRRERERVAHSSGGECHGNRHHYWHLDPMDPNETLYRHGEAGLDYDSSLGLEYYPGFRRGICHPFRVYHPARRRASAAVQLPPAWMDDHFDRRLARNHISNPDAAAKLLLDVARDTRGIVVIDYHSRGMNRDFYPRYGPWLSRFVEQHLDGSFSCLTPWEIATAFLERERELQRHSIDQTIDATDARVRLVSAAEPGPETAS